MAVYWVIDIGVVNLYKYSNQTLPPYIIFVLNKYIVTTQQ